MDLQTVTDLFFADKFVKEAFKYKCSEPIFSVAEDVANYYRMTYISLFSSAGIGRCGFKQSGFEYTATNELLTKILKIQAFNDKCKYDTGYISGGITKKEVQQQLLKELSFWKEKHKIKEPDVLIATPPCQGMSVANHKRNNEKSRNSLVVESIKLTSKILPRYFVFENVRAFLGTIRTDIDGVDKPIEDYLFAYYLSLVYFMITLYLIVKTYVKKKH